MVIIPSMMKIHAQPGRPSRPFRFSIAAARRPPKDPAKAAAEKKTAWDVRLETQRGRYTHCSNAELVTLVPAREKVVDPGEETSFSYAQEPAGCHQA